jgi:hypothetical protein
VDLWVTSAAGLIVLWLLPFPWCLGSLGLGLQMMYDTKKKLFGSVSVKNT